MVVLLYFLMVLPLAWYLLAFAYETFLAFHRIGRKSFDKESAYIHGTWEVTHTMLVYSFTVFMISFAGLLPRAASQLFLPIAVFMCALMTRGSLYLYLFYSSDQVNLSRFWNLIFALAHLVSWLAVLLGAVRMARLIQSSHFTPSTLALNEVAVGFVLVAIVSLLPLVQLYRRPHHKKSSVA